MGCIVMKFWSDLNTNAFRSVLFKANNLSYTAELSEKSVMSRMQSLLGYHKGITALTTQR